MRLSIILIVNCVTKVGKMQAISFGHQVPSEYRVKPVRREDYKEAQQNRERMMHQFSSNENLRRAYMDAVRTANLTDKQLLSIAKQDANRDSKYKVGTYAATLAAVPAIDTFMAGLATESPKLSGKLGAMGKTAAGWAGVFALAGLYNSAVQKITAVSPVMQKFEDKHPVIKALLSLAGFAALLIGGQKGLKKLAEVLPKKMPGVVADIAKSKAAVAEFINNTKLNTKVLKPIKDKVVAWAAKHPKVASTSLSALALSVPFMAMGALFKAFTDKAEKSEQIKDNYNRLVDARDRNRAALMMLDMQTEPMAKMADVVSDEYANEFQTGSLDIEV